MNKEEFWQEQPEGYTSLEPGSWNQTLHPKIIDLVNQRKPATYLDFGCGGAKLDTYLHPDIPVSVYDISQGMLDEAERNLGDRLDKRYDQMSDIPDNYFEMVVTSLMLMCIGDEAEYKANIQKIHDCLTPGGQAIIALTHPCFRQYAYSDFQAKYATDQPFDYFKEGDPFEVKIIDSKSEIFFIDYHWSMSMTLNSMIQAGLVIEGMIEVPDSIYKKGANPKVAPYVIIYGRKK